MTKSINCGIIIHVVAGMVELADTSVLEADAERREGSSPFTRTTNVKSTLNLKKIDWDFYLLFFSNPTGIGLLFLIFVAEIFYYFKYNAYQTSKRNN